MRILDHLWISTGLARAGRWEAGVSKTPSLRSLLILLSVGFLIFGRLSDIFGRKYLVIAFQVLGLIGCIIGATAQGINVLIGSNLLNGIAAAGQLSFGIIIGELVPNKLRGPAITIIFLSSLPFAGTFKTLHWEHSFSDLLQYLDHRLPAHSSSIPPRNGDGATTLASSAMP